MTDICYEDKFTRVAEQLVKVETALIHARETKQILIKGVLRRAMMNNGVVISELELHKAELIKEFKVNCGGD